MLKFISLYIILIIQFLSTKQKLCGRNEIANCNTCDLENEICLNCINGYFPLFAGLECIKCNHEKYGQKACEGKCDFENGKVLCDKCIEGYYSVDGVCFTCSSGSENCAKCSYEASPGSSQKIYKCLECVGGPNSIYRVSNVDGKCRTCTLPPHCLECAYIYGTNGVKCIRCEDGYYPSNGQCISCNYQYNDITGGSCSTYYCPGNINHNKKTCYCNSNYALKPPSTCLACQSNCNSCEYVQSTDSVKCNSCNSRYALSPQNTCVPCPSNCKSCNYYQCIQCESGFEIDLNKVCISCGEHCSSCYIDNNNKPICISCDSSYILTDNEKICELLSIPDHCNNYANKRFNNKDEVICTSCDSYYTLDGTNNKCLNCPSHCTRCHFDESNNFYCDDCGYDYVLNSNKLCESCTNNIMIGGEGCIHCKYEGGINKCTQCRNDYIFIRNDYVCKLPSEVNLNVTCEEATRLENGHYSCNKCRNQNYALIVRYNSTNDCYPAKNELIYCNIGYEDENKNLSCTKCLYNYRFIWSDDYQINICDNQCGSDYFFNYDLDVRGCYKCDDESGGGQIGCNPKKGCKYVAADNHLYCNSCKTGYFLYDWQCLTCSKKDSNCIDCDFNITEKKFKCNKCISNIFYVNNETGLCDKITYDEYPEVTAGCILPINNYTTYIKNKKCFDCKYGFFKTKEESCIYCKARKNGGPKCDKCQYIIDRNGKEIDKINCKECQEDNMWSPIGRKCYNCEDEVGPGCAKCTFEDETERVICEECKEDYYLNNEGYCTKKYSYAKSIPNCLIYEGSNLLRLLPAGLRCKICNDGYYVDDRYKCKNLTLEKCSFKSMINIQKSIYDECKKYCEMNFYPIVDYKDNNEKIENILKNNLQIPYDSLEKEIKDIIENGKLCINNIDENNGLRKCINIEYDLNTNKFKCLKCVNGYELVNSNNRCVQKTEVEKNITKQECNSETIFIKAEKDTFCEKPIGELEGCANGTIADTQYANTKYNCYNCSSDYRPSYSHYFKRTLCVGAYVPPIENSKKLPKDAYKGIDKDTDIEDGKCTIEETFTPDGENCYLCNNNKVGMPGCKGSCTYSTSRINIIECEEGCMSGYLETSEGVCESCDVVNKGCLNCNYNKNYPAGYSDFKRQNRFECKECDEGYQLTKDGYCHHCTEFGFTYCDKCIKNIDNNELECIKCIDGYFLANNGYCHKCDAPKVQGILNRCIFCNNTEEGGIEGCELCVSDNGNITCQQCKKGFILSEDDNTCIKIEDFPEIEAFSNCQKVSKNNSKDYKCTKCFENYNDLYDKNRDEKLCVNNEFLLTPKPETLKYCKKSINMGTEDKPKHSCEKCIENDILTQEQREQGISFTKFTYSENETSFCDINNNYYKYGILENCSEARRIKNEEGNLLINCTKCIDENKFIYKIDLDLKICTYFFYSKYCMVKNCRTCKYGNNYFCSQCLFDNYEVNPATGSCVKKLPKEPAISWKDMFRLELNSKTLLNSHNLTGSSVYLRGISGNQFNTGHAFKINLVFDYKYNRNLRNIEENDIETKEIKIPSYCQIIEHTDEVKNKVNLIDYFCFANRTGEDEIRETDIRLKKIEVSHDDNLENSEFIEFSNFEDMISELNIDELKDKDTSSFTLRKFNNVTVFEMDEVVDQKSENYTFDFIIYGRINKELEPDIIKTKFELKRIKNIFADCEFHIKENQTAELKCHVNLEEHKEKEVFKFRTIEFQYKHSSIYLNRFNEINLVHEEREKKSNTLTIIIIVIAIILFIIIAILLIFLIRKLSKKNNDLNIISKYDLSEKKKKHKRSLKNIQDKPYYTSTTQRMQTTETNSKKRSIKNQKESDKIPSAITKVEINITKKDKEKNELNY